MARALRRNGQSGARSSNGDGGALRTRGAGARGRERESGRARMAAEGEASATGGS